MSGFVGLFNLDGRPADEQLVARMLGAIAHRGPDASRVWSSGAVGFGYCLLATTPESVGEVQPLVEGGVAVVFDGRLDNRRELADDFAAARLPPPTGADAAFVAAAYRRWGTDCAARLLGDFAFAVWDPDRRQIFCARDVMAQRPFYYHHSANLFLFASEPRALLKHPAVSRRPNEGMVGEHLSVLTSTTETLFADMQRLAPAHRLAVSRDALRRDAYWRIDTARTIRYAAVDDYCEHLRALLREVVGDRLRSSTDTGVMLSGGVDSSSLLATATELRRSGRLGHDCHALSMIDPGGPLDEREFMDRTVAMLRCRSHQFQPAAVPLSAYRASTRARAYVTSSPSATLMDSLKRGARQRGIRVLLNGIGSDEWLGGSSYHTADLFRSLRWRELGSYVRSALSAGLIESPASAAKLATWPLLSRGTRKLIKTVIGHHAVPRWIRPDFAARIDLADRLYPGDPDEPFPTIAQRSIYRHMRSGLSIHGFEEEERSAAAFGVEIRYPFADRRLMEFALAIPEELRRRGDTRKFVLREAMRETLPHEVRLRRASPDAAVVYVPVLRELAAEGVFDQPAIEREGWVDAAEVRAFCDGILGGQELGGFDYTRDDWPEWVGKVWPMWTVASLELWMREVADRSGDIDNEDEEGTCAIKTVRTNAR